MRALSRSMLGGAALAALLLGAAGAGAAPDGVIRVGSKSFTESYILAEVAAQIIEQVGEARVERRVGLGGTGLTYRALESGAIDLYPSTPVRRAVLLKDASPRRPRPFASGCGRAAHGQRSLGLAEHVCARGRADTAERLKFRTIGDLARHPELRAAFSSGFLERADGWPGLRARYGLRLARVEVMEHALTYRAIASGEVDVMDVFSTDGQLERLKLRLLDDDRRFFPDYWRCPARRDMHRAPPAHVPGLRETLEGRLDGVRMARLNAMADLDGRRVSEVAAVFLGGGTAAGAGRHREMVAELAALTVDHLVLVLISVGVAIVLGIPMGIVAARYRRAGQLELSAIAMLQTVPALALLMFMIPLFGIGKGPALVALSLTRCCRSRGTPTRG
jgi:osmoprotectant transport system permease protein